jgi:2-polyprenyl-3-methyl-5-hydroxy-6-metoxy-1,4-benzoquinol methylase
MNQEHYEKNLEFTQRAVRYNRYLMANIEEFMGRTVLDVGCGTGNLTRLIRDRLVVGIDCTERYLSRFESNVRGMHAFLLDIQDTYGLTRIHAFMFDTILCSNVLEHVEDDLLALRNMHRLLIGGGRLVLLVPSFKFLYGSLDRTNLHFRRYSKSELVMKLQKAGFKTERLFYLNALGIFWWVFHSKIKKSRFTGCSEAGLVNLFVPLVKLADNLLSKRIGLTLVAVATR